MARKCRRFSIGRFSSGSCERGSHTRPARQGIRGEVRPKSTFAGRVGGEQRVGAFTDAPRALSTRR
jgi:hypothetical protein